MMHESMEITDRLYGRLTNDEVKETISGFGIQSDSKSEKELFEEFLAFKKWVDQNKQSNQ